MSRRGINGHLQARDADGNVLVAGDEVRSTPAYEKNGEIVDGVVTETRGGMIVVKHMNGASAGQKWRSASRFWRKKEKKVDGRQDRSGVHE